MIIKPVRLQLSRKKGFRLVSPNGLPIVVVSRPSKWGNFFLRKDYCFYEENGYPNGYDWRRMATEDFEKVIKWLIDNHPKKYILNKKAIEYPVIDMLFELPNCNLACWCPIPEEGKPDYCHGSVLLKIANE